MCVCVWMHTYIYKATSPQWLRGQEGSRRV